MITSQNNNDFIIENLFGSRARIKILKTLVKNNELSISQIIRNTRLNHSSVVNHLNHLIRLNLVQEKRYGRIKILRYRLENIKARSLKKFIEIWEGEF
jgi:DNA-binding transcriptional ArsR family regulator